MRSRTYHTGRKQIINRQTTDFRKFSISFQNCVCPLGSLNWQTTILISNTPKFSWQIKGHHIPLPTQYCIGNAHKTTTKIKTHWQKKTPMVVFCYTWNRHQEADFRSPFAVSAVSTEDTVSEIQVKSLHQTSNISHLQAGIIREL